ncbi:MAG TPA: hypothetical protein VKR24_12320 [Candidatus Limnocylindrales bacterium]|nr:hypothetical protein [Candidatus Limnocylindrales bacterium]
MSGTTSSQRPAGMCLGTGHLVVYGNPAFVATFGPHCVGMPARETMLSLPAEAFELLDAVLAEGRPLARWIAIGVDQWRLTAMPRLDFETGRAYGVSFHLRRRSDLPVVRPERTLEDARREWLSPPSP